MCEPIDFVLSERMSETSRAALTTPSQFLFLDRKHREHKERRQFVEVPPEPSAFGYLTPTLRQEPVAAD